MYNFGELPENKMELGNFKLLLLIKPHKLNICICLLPCIESVLGISNLIYLCMCLFTEEGS